MTNAAIPNTKTQNPISTNNTPAIWTPAFIAFPFSFQIAGTDYRCGDYINSAAWPELPEYVKQAFRALIRTA
jgi:hypothetical protein